VVGLLIATAAALISSILGTNYLVSWLRSNRVGQPIHEDVPAGHTVKAGTPTMGGVAIVSGAVIGYMVAHLHHGVVFTRSGLLVMLAIAGAGTVGLLDDWIKVTAERNLGLSKGAKTLGLLAVAVGFSVLAVSLTPVHTTISFTRFNDIGWNLHAVGWVVWATLFIYGASNAVNLTDGLDGLAAGSASFGFVVFTVIGFWGFRHSCPTGLTSCTPAMNIYHLDHSYDLAICAASMLGACIGFLWWNAAPAQIFMGDTGSLAIGTGLAALALLNSTELLMPIVGGLFVLETLSVMIQVFTFRVLRGRRLFRMAPIHHHFELCGWPETTVIIRFWILAALFASIAIGFYYADFLQQGGSDLGGLP
jgi:phospho-N-acetylmuramoyl-pentapeptide-transferase